MLMHELFGHYKSLVESGELTPQGVPVARKIRDEWGVSGFAAERVRRRLLDAGLAAPAPSLTLPLGLITDELMQARFWPKVDPVNADGCLLWNASTSKGYGQFNLNGRTRRAHRVAWEYLMGEPIPEGMEIDHVFARGCRSTLCVRLEHLEVVTTAENARRRGAAERYRAGTGVLTELDDD